MINGRSTVIADSSENTVAFIIPNAKDKNRNPIIYFLIKPAREPFPTLPSKDWKNSNDFHQGSIYKHVL